MEAMAIGLPNIGSRIRGVTDLLENECGGMFDVFSVRQLAEQINKSLKSPQIADKWRENAKNKIKEFELTKIISLHEKVYEDLCLQRNGL